MNGLEGHHLFTDNYYTVPEVNIELYKCSKNCCGTVSTISQRIPEETKQQQDRGYPLLAATWYEKQYVYFLFTMHVVDTPGITVCRRNPDGTATDVHCCQITSSTWDTKDQLIGYYNIGWRSKTWRKKVFSYIIECALVNAYIIERHAKPSLYPPS